MRRTLAILAIFVSAPALAQDSGEALLHPGPPESARSQTPDAIPAVGAQKPAAEAQGHPLRVWVESKAQPLWESPLVVALVGPAIAFLAAVLVQAWALRHERRAAKEQFDRERQEQRILFDAERNEQERIRKDEFAAERLGTIMVLRAEMSNLLGLLFSEAKTSYEAAQRGSSTGARPRGWSVRELYQSQLPSLAKLLDPGLISAAVEFHAVVRDVRDWEISTSQEGQAAAKDSSIEFERAQLLYRSLRIAVSLEEQFWSEMVGRVRPEQAERRAKSRRAMEAFLSEAREYLRFRA